MGKLTFGSSVERWGSADVKGYEVGGGEGRYGDGWMWMGRAVGGAGGGDGEGGEGGTHHHR